MWSLRFESHSLDHTVWNPNIGSSIWTPQCKHYNVDYSIDPHTASNRPPNSFQISSNGNRWTLLASILWSLANQWRQVGNELSYWTLTTELLLLNSYWRLFEEIGNCRILATRTCSRCNELFGPLVSGLLVSFSLKLSDQRGIASIHVESTL